MLLMWHGYVILFCEILSSLENDIRAESMVDNVHPRLGTRIYCSTKAPFLWFDLSVRMSKLEGLFLGYSQAWWTTE